MNAAWPREPSSRSTEAITTWTSAIPPLVAHAFWPLITHSSAGLVVLGVGADRRDVGAGVGLRRAERGDLRVVGGAEALLDPLGHLLGRALAEDRGDRERGAHDRHPDPGVAPEQLLVDDRQGQARTGRTRTEPGPRSRRGRSSRPPGSPARASPRARPIRRRRGGRRRRRTRGPSRGCPSGPGSARARRWARNRRLPDPGRRPARPALRRACGVQVRCAPRNDATSAYVTSIRVRVSSDHVNAATRSSFTATASASASRARAR